mgnify:CR=1 FL=1
MFAWNAIELWFGAQIHFGAIGRVRENHLRYFTGWVVQITKHQRVHWTDLNAGRFFTCCQIGLAAEVALIGCSSDWIDKSHMVRAGGNTIATTDAALVVNIDNASKGIFKRCAGRADRHTWWVFAMLARFTKVLTHSATGRRARNINRAQDLEAGNADGHIIGLFTGTAPGFAADSTCLVV